jgi:hypothetical protein
MVVNSRFAPVGNAEVMAGWTISRRPYGAANPILQLTQDCVRWRELVLG